MSDLTPIYRTREGTTISIKRGTKSENDYIVKYLEPHSKARVRTPKHIHIVVDLFIKRAQAPELTSRFLDHLVDVVCANVKPIRRLPPKLVTFSEAHLERFSGLNKYGEYSVEFILVVVELIQTQEITNYPDGVGHIGLYKMLRDGKGIFSVVSAAVFR